MKNFYRRNYHVFLHYVLHSETWAGLASAPGDLHYWSDTKLYVPWERLFLPWHDTLFFFFLELTGGRGGGELSPTLPSVATGFLCGFPTQNMSNMQVLFGRRQPSGKQGWENTEEEIDANRGKKAHSSGVNLVCYHIPSFPIHHCPSGTWYVVLGSPV